MEILLLSTDLRHKVFKAQIRPKPNSKPWSGVLHSDNNIEIKIKTFAVYFFGFGVFFVVLVGFF